MRLPSHTTVAAYLALFVAVGTGGAYAAATITGADVVDESLTGADVRGRHGTSSTAGTNGALTGADISGQPANAATGQRHVNGSLTGWDLADGSVRGADVDEGSLAQVPSALRSVYSNHADRASLADTANTMWAASRDSFVLPSEPACNFRPCIPRDAILRLDLPPGSYLIIGKLGTIAGAYAELARCRTVAGGNFDAAAAIRRADLQHDHMTMVVPHTNTQAFSAYLACTATPEYQDKWRGTYAKLMAVRLASVVRQRGY